MRLQTFCEDRFEFCVLADVFATCNWALLPDQPWISIVPGAPVTWRAVLPTLRRVGETLRCRCGAMTARQPVASCSRPLSPQGQCPGRRTARGVRMADRRAEPSAQGIVGRTRRPGDHTPRRGRVRTRYEQSAAHRYEVGAPAVLGRHAWAVGRDDRHQQRPPTCWVPATWPSWMLCATKATTSRSPRN